MNHKRTPALRYILQGSHANYFFERHIEHALGSEPATAEKLAHRAIFTVQQLLGASHPVGIYQPLEVASEVVVHRITQVGRISCRILYSNTNCLNTSCMCDNFNDVRAISGSFLFIIDNNIR